MTNQKATDCFSKKKKEEKEQAKREPGGFFHGNTLHEKCSNTQFSWSIFSRIWTEYRDFLSKFLYSVQIRENTDQKTLYLGNFYAMTIILVIKCEKWLIARNLFGIFLCTFVNRVLIRKNIVDTSFSFSFNEIAVRRFSQPCHDTVSIKLENLPLQTKWGHGL